jgi:hypothetical protein
MSGQTEETACLELGDKPRMYRTKPSSNALDVTGTQPVYGRCVLMHGEAEEEGLALGNEQQHQLLTRSYSLPHITSSHAMAALIDSSAKSNCRKTRTLQPGRQTWRPVGGARQQLHTWLVWIQRAYSLG